MAAAACAESVGEGVTVTVDAAGVSVEARRVVAVAATIVVRMRTSCDWGQAVPAR